MQVFDFGCGLKSKARNFWKFSFFHFKQYLSLLVFVLLHFFVVFKSSVTTAAKIWSKRQIFDLGQNRKLVNLKNVHFFVSTFLFKFVFFVVSKSSVEYAVKIWKKRQISETSILGIRQNQKLGNLGNFHLSS